MLLNQKIEKLGTEVNTPCVTISLNTHRTHPDNAQDTILLKNLLNEAEERIVNEFDRRSVAPLLEKLSEININNNYTLDSLHIFLSNDTNVVIKSPWSTPKNRVQISDTFALSSIIKSLNRSEEYNILLLSQGGAKFYNAANDRITVEIKNDDFPFPESPYFVANRERRSDGELIDNLVRQYFNKVDKAVIKLYNETGLPCVVICTEDNYSRFIEVADRPEIYLGYANIDYNNTDPHHIVKQAWEIVKVLHDNRINAAINEIKEAEGQGKVITDLQEIYKASVDGRGDLLLVNLDYIQPVLMSGEKTFELVTDNTKPDAIDDITNNIAWEVLSKKGRVFFTSKDESKNFGNIALKTRY